MDKDIIYSQGIRKQTSMIEIKIDDKYKSFLDEYSTKLDIGGRSNLSNSDLAKASRKEYNYTGLYGELIYRLFMYGTADDLPSIIDKKIEHYNATGLGDNGKDDEITYKNYTRIVDIKSSHTENENRIKNLNLIIPSNEYHPNQKMIFVAAFTVGKKRMEVEKAILAGFSYTEDIFRKWKFDKSKFCVEVKELRDMMRLKEKIAAPSAALTSNG